MKTRSFLLVLILSSLYTHQSKAQSEFDKINIQTLDGIELPLENVLKNKPGKPVVLFTWSKEWCGPCVKVLDNFDITYYKGLRDDFGLKFVALNLDAKTEIDEIKQYAINRKWYFDVYQDPDGNYLKTLALNAAPQTYLIIDNKIINYKSGFIKGTSNPVPNSEYIYHMIQSIGGNVVYFDEDWNFTSKEEATYVRYVDFNDGIYEVQDRWISGELQMRGKYLDKFTSERHGKFTWYYKNGKKSTESEFDKEKQTGKSSQWYESGQLWVTEQYVDDNLYNILELYDKTGKPLSKGTLSNGNGYIYRYNDQGVRTSKQEYENGKLHGKVTVYADGKVKDEYLYEKGVFIKKIE